MREELLEHFYMTQFRKTHRMKGHSLFICSDIALAQLFLASYLQKVAGTTYSVIWKEQASVRGAGGVDDRVLIPAKWVATRFPLQYKRVGLHRLSRQTRLSYLCRRNLAPKTLTNAATSTTSTKFTIHHHNVKA